MKYTPYKYQGLYYDKKVIESQFQITGMTFSAYAARMILWKKFLLINTKNSDFNDLHDTMKTL